LADDNQIDARFGFIAGNTDVPKKENELSSPHRRNHEIRLCYAGTCRPGKHEQWFDG
jgi:hypothetical protein